MGTGHATTDRQLRRKGLPRAHRAQIGVGVGRVGERIGVELGTRLWSGICTSLAVIVVEFVVGILVWNAFFRRRIDRSVAIWRRRG